MGLDIEMDRFFRLVIHSGTTNSGSINEEWREYQNNESGQGWYIYLNDVYTGINIFKFKGQKPRIYIDLEEIKKNLPVDLQKHFFKPPTGSYIVQTYPPIGEK